MNKRSFQVALGGLIAALCLLLLFLTGVFPFATYALPAIAGFLMVVIVIENGYTWSVLVYIAVAILAFFITPDREAALMFIFFFGYYPILKAKLEKLKPRLLEYALKLLIFNVSVVFAYLIIIFIFQIPDIFTEFGDFGKYSVFILLGVGNMIFLIYDFALTQIISVYINWFRPRFLRRYK